jgi:hypothetical protein
MLAALLALLAAVATTLVYLVLTEELDYSSVRRRQLDAWAAVVAVACMAVILYGNASGRQHVLPTPEPDTVPPSIEHREVPRQSTANAPAVEPVGPTAPVDVVADVGPVAPPAEIVAESEPLSEGGSSSERSEGGVDDGVPVDVPGKESTVPTPQLAVPGEPTMTPAPPTPVPPEVAPPPLPTRPLQVPGPTRVRPTSPPPTTLPTGVPYASPTPECGDPARIDIRVGDVTTEIDRSGGQVLVHFRFDVRNASDFPVTLASMRVHAGAGPDIFGSTSLSEVTIESGAVYPVDDLVVIERYPAPSERVQLCVTFVPETCGRARAEQRMGGRCWSGVAGF